MQADSAHRVDDDRHSRQIRLPGLGAEGQQRLASARVVVVGAGGLGSVVLPSLAAAGIGAIEVVDDDRVDLSNLQRQTIHGTSDIGRHKVASAIDALGRIDAAVRVTGRTERLTAQNALAVLGDADVIVDGSDNFPTRYLVNDAGHLLGIPVVWGSVAQYAGQVGVSMPGEGPGYRDLFPVPPAPDSVVSCEVGGVLGPACTVVGGQMAAETIKLITGVGQALVGTVTTYDALTGRFRQLEYRRDPTAASVTELIDYAVFCGLPMEVTVTDLADLMASTTVQLVDVREPWEREVARLPGSIDIPLAELADSSDVPENGLIIAYCHHGTRSQAAVRMLAERGITASSLVGGIDAYARLIDTTMARY